MLKGVTKSVIVVPSPDPSLFESAIFILRPEAVPDEEESRRRLLREAGLIAGLYVRERVPAGRRGVPAPAWAGIGAAAALAAAGLLRLIP